MKIFLPLILCFVSLAAMAQQEKQDPNFHLYLLVGQSNMAGRGAVDSQSTRVHPRLLMLDSLNHWVPAVDPVHFDKPKMVGVGPAMGFATAMLEKNKNLTIGLIPCAVGGSPLSVWQPGAIYLDTYHPYDAAIARGRLASQKGVLKGILWHQGESDNDSLHASLYLEKLKMLIGLFRATFKQPNLPFVAGEIGYFNKNNFINPVLAQLPQQVAYTAVVSARGLTDKGDHLHFDTPSARELGQRYAIAMKDLQARRNKPATSR